MFLILNRKLPQKTLSYTITMAGEGIKHKNAIAQFPLFVLWETHITVEQQRANMKIKHNLKRKPWVIKSIVCDNLSALVVFF